MTAAATLQNCNGLHATLRFLISMTGATQQRATMPTRDVKSIAQSTLARRGASCTWLMVVLRTDHTERTLLYKIIACCNDIVLTAYNHVDVLNTVLTVSDSQ